MPTTAAARPDAIRRHNLSLVLTHIHQDGAITRAELTQRLKVSRSTVGALVADLIALGLVDEEVPGRGSGVGRPSHVVGPHRSGPFVLAVDLDVTHVTVAAVGLGGTVLARETVPTEPASLSPDAAARLIVDSIPRLQKAGCPTSRPAGIGVSVPGTVDRRSGHVGVAPNLEWHDAPLGAPPGRHWPRTGCPWRSATTPTSRCWPSTAAAAPAACDDVVFVMGRVGVGAGIIAGGAAAARVQRARRRDRPRRRGRHRARSATAASAAASRPTSATAPCWPGPDGTARRPRLRSPRSTPTPPRATRPRCGSVHAVAEALGRAAASLINTLNPQRVLLGGSLTQLLDVARPQFEHALGRYALETQGASVLVCSRRWARTPRCSAPPRWPSSR